MLCTGQRKDDDDGGDDDDDDEVKGLEKEDAFSKRLGSSEMEKRSRKGNVEKEHKKQSEMGSGTMSSMTLGKKEKGKTSDDNGRANSTDNKANSDAQNKTQKHTSQREQLDLEKKISESEFAGLEVIPECSFKNTSVIMTRTIENTFYK